MKTPLYKKETTSASNWKVIRDGEAERHAGKKSLSFWTFQFSALKGLKN